MRVESSILIALTNTPMENLHPKVQRCPCVQYPSISKIKWVITAFILGTLEKDMETGTRVHGPKYQ